MFGCEGQRDLKQQTAIKTPWQGELLYGVSGFRLILWESLNSACLRLYFIHFFHNPRFNVIISHILCVWVCV